MLFYKTSEVAKEEARLEALNRLYSDGKISTSEYIQSINRLKESGEGGKQTNVMGVVQFGLFVALAGMAVYLVRKYA